MTFKDAAKKLAETVIYSPGVDRRTQYADSAFTAVVIDCGVALYRRASGTFLGKGVGGGEHRLNWRLEAFNFLTKSIFPLCGGDLSRLRVIVLTCDCYEVENELCLYKRHKRQLATEAVNKATRAVSETTDQDRFRTWYKTVYLPNVGKALLRQRSVGQKTLVVLRGFHQKVPGQYCKEWDKTKSYGLLTYFNLDSAEINSDPGCGDIWDGNASISAAEGDLAALSMASMLSKSHRPYKVLFERAGVPEWDVGELNVCCVSQDGDIVNNSVMLQLVNPVENLSIFKCGIASGNALSTLEKKRQSLDSTGRFISNKKQEIIVEYFYRPGELVQAIRETHGDPVMFMTSLAICGNDYVTHIRSLSPSKFASFVGQALKTLKTMEDYDIFSKDSCLAGNGMRDRFVNWFGDMPPSVMSATEGVHLNTALFYEVVISALFNNKKSVRLISCSCDDEIFSTCNQAFGNQIKKKARHSTLILEDDEGNVIPNIEQGLLQLSKDRITHHELYLLYQSMNHYLTYVQRELLLSCKHTHKVTTTSPGFMSFNMQVFYHCDPADDKMITSGCLPPHFGYLDPNTWKINILREGEPGPSTSKRKAQNDGDDEDDSPHENKVIEE